MSHSNPHPVSPFARTLGYAGLLPQMACAALVIGDSEWQWVAAAIAWAYAASIFSFVGGMWWGLALANPPLDKRVYVAAVVPSTIALLSILPWMFGYPWPGPSLVVLGLCFMASPVVELWIAKHISLPVGWQKIRWHLSLGIGGLSALTGVFS